MKLKKVIGTLIVFIMVLSIVAGFSNVKAETVDYKLGIVRLRKSGYGYALRDLTGDLYEGIPECTLWKIVTYDSNGKNYNYDNAIYCINAEQGFEGSGSFIEDGKSKVLDYVISKDMKTEKDSILDGDFSSVSDMFKDEKSVANGDTFCITEWERQGRCYEI